MFSPKGRAVKDDRIPVDSGYGGYPKNMPAFPSQDRLWFTSHVNTAFTDHPSLKLFLTRRI